QSAFPEQFSVAHIRVKDGSLLQGLYLGSTADTIVVGKPPDPRKGPRCATSSHAPSRILLVARSTIERIELRAGPDPCRPPGSLLRRLGVMPLECIAPLCQVGDGPHR